MAEKRIQQLTQRIKDGFKPTLYSAPTSHQMNAHASNQRNTPPTLSTKPAYGGSNHQARLMMLQEVSECYVFDGMTKIPSMTKLATIGLPGLFKPLLSGAKLTLDTGANKGSYIGRAQLDKIQEEAAKIHGGVRLTKLPHPHIVKIGNGQLIEARESVWLAISIEGGYGSPALPEPAHVTLFVLDQLGCELLIGLPDILGPFYSTFIDSLEEMREVSTSVPTSASPSDSTLFTIKDPSDFSDCTQPWTLSPEVCAEDTYLPDPTMFGNDVLYFMETSVEDASSKFHSDLIDRIDPDLLSEYPEVLDLLHEYEEVFVPRSWDGLKMDPIALQIQGELPSRLLQRARPIRPLLLENAKTEFYRLSKYFFVPSDSQYASPLVVAPKATKPFIRLCGDYRRINPYIRIPQEHIPYPWEEIQKAASFPYYIDTDMANSFHQIPIDERSSELLSVQTPWGLYRPKFMPEGVGPASGLLMRIVRDIFVDFSDWTVVIFDNFLILAHDKADAIAKLRKVLQRCREHRIVLKLSKSIIGTTKVSFFGYEVGQGKWHMSKERLEGIASIQFPQNTKMMQSFLGSGLFCHKHIKDHSRLSKDLYEMTHKDFIWKEASWTKDYRASFEAYKAALRDAMVLTFPDYNLTFVLTVDASMQGCGWVLAQWRPTVGGHVPKPPQPASHPLDSPAASVPNTDGPLREIIAVGDHVFSGAATRWEVIKQEFFGIVFGVKSNEYYLRGKKFILETDHANLLWLEQATSPILVRWRIYLQGFDFVLRHIPGKENKIADYLSRMHPMSVPDAPTPLPSLSSDSPSETDSLGTLFLLDAVTPTPAAPTAHTPIQDPHEMTISQALASVHGGRAAHYGVNHTWREAKILHPTLPITIAMASEYVRNCPVCQKTRNTTYTNLPEHFKTLKSDVPRQTIGCDIITLEEDRWGYVAGLIVAEHWSKFVQIYALKTYTAEEVAGILLTHISRYGLFDSLASDPGSVFLSDVVLTLNRWLGLKSKISLVQRHESNGCERIGQEATRHLRNICLDERARKTWSSAHILPWVNFLLNSFPSSETGGISPFELKFGSDSAPFSRFPDCNSLDASAPAYLRSLNDNLRWIQAKSQKAQDHIIAERTARNNPAGTPKYIPGDLILWHYRETTHSFRQGKLSADWRGPYSVVAHTGNDITCDHLSTHSRHVFHVTRVKPFFGDSAHAMSLALLDADDYVVDSIVAHTGLPTSRPDMRFRVRWSGYTDEFDSWLPWTGLRDNSRFHDYCRSRSLLSLIPREHRIPTDPPTRVRIVAPPPSAPLDAHSDTYAPPRLQLAPATPALESSSSRPRRSARSRW